MDKFNLLMSGLGIAASALCYYIGAPEVGAFSAFLAGALFERALRS